MDPDVGWYRIEKAEFDELLRLSRVYYREAHRCQTAKAYVAGCAMSGAALEALLLAMVNLYPDDAQATGRPPKSKDKIKPLLSWGLGELVDVAAKSGWLPTGLQASDVWNTKRARIGDYARVVQQLRNLVHPGRYIKDHSPSRVTKKYLARSLEILDVANRYLEARVHESLRRQLESQT
jgi:hypothetical protein